MNRVDIIIDLHKSTNRDYLQRMIDDKVECMITASKFEFDYWDGDRKFGYGGYQYDGRWKSTAQKIIEKYNLNKSSKVLDVGCGMGHLLYEVQQITGCEILGLDISKYAKEKSNISRSINTFDIRRGLDFKENEFDLVLSIMTLHNFEIQEVNSIVKDIEKVGKNKYIAVESFRNEKELFNLQCWALTCKSFLSLQSWEWLFKNTGYSGEVEFLFFE